MMNEDPIKKSIRKNKTVLQEKLALKHILDFNSLSF